jgi:hypothetical protein
MRDSLSEPDRYRDSHGPDANSVGNPRGCAPPRRSGQLADYYPLIALAVNRLEPSTAETRRTIYDRARAAMVAQLRSLTPTLSESDINREQLALDRAIRKVEAESLRRSRTPPQPSIRQPDTPPGPIRDTGEEQAEMSNGVEPSRYATRPRSSPVILDEDPARDDLAFAKKLAMDNPDLSAELEVLQKEICDRRGSLMVLSAPRLIPCLSGCYIHPQYLVLD